MPRPNPTDAFENNEFHDQGGYIVAEAEMLPTPRDESWLAETHLPGYTGTGYLRAIRDQQVRRQKGLTPIHLNADTPAIGRWRFAAAAIIRSDSEPREFWVKVGDGPWLIGSLNRASVGPMAVDAVMYASHREIRHANLYVQRETQRCLDRSEGREPQDRSCRGVRSRPRTKSLGHQDPGVPVPSMGQSVVAVKLRRDEARRSLPRRTHG